MNCGRNLPSHANGPARSWLGALGLASLLLLTSCGGGSNGPSTPPGPTPPPAGRYAFARHGTQLLAIPLDAQASSPITLAPLASEPDFALPVERLSDPDHGAGRYHDQLLFNGGRVLWLSGQGDGKSPVHRELAVPGFTVRACDHVGGPDDPAVALIRARQGAAVVEVDVRFSSITGCIDAAGDRTLSVPLPPTAPVVLPANELRTGLQTDGTAQGTLKLGGTELVYAHSVNGSLQQDSLPPAAEDVGRILVWQALARDAQGVFLCGRIDANPRCALYHFAPDATPHLSKLSADDYSPVQMGGMADGRAYVVSYGPAPVAGSTTLRMPSVHEFGLSAPFPTRLAVSLTPEYRLISLDQSVLFYAMDTVRYSQYRLVDAASGSARDTDFYQYGSGSSGLFADHRIGCVVAHTLPATREQSGCSAQAWIAPNYVNGVMDRTVYLVGPGGERLQSYVFGAVATAAGFVGYETAADLLVGVKLADGSTQLWRVPRLQGDQRSLLAQGDVTLYGTVRPRGSVL